jgi:hypothetical protein
MANAADFSGRSVRQYSAIEFALEVLKSRATFDLPATAESRTLSRNGSALTQRVSKLDL